MVSPATALSRRLAPKMHTSLAVRRLPRAFVDGALYAAAVLVSSMLFAAIWRLDYGPATALLKFEPLGLATFLAVVTLLHLYDRPVAATLRDELSRSAGTVSLSVLCAMGVMLLGVNDPRPATPFLLVLPTVVIAGAALRVRFPRAAPAAPGQARVSDATEGYDLPRLMQSLAQRIVGATGIDACRLFTRSTDGGALVLRGAANRAMVISRDGRLSRPPRVRIPIADIPWLDRIVSAGSWLEIGPGDATLEDADAIVQALYAPEGLDGIAVAPLRVSDGPVGVVCVILGGGSTAEREARLRAVEAMLAEHTGTIETALRLRALGSAASPWWRMLRDLPYGVAVANPATRVLSLNGPAEGLLGGPAAIFAGRRLCVQGQGCDCPVHTALRTGAPVRTEASALFDPLEGGVPASSATIWPIIGASGAPELMLIVLGPEAGAPEIPGVGAEVSAMISHELRAPLATLRMASELALEDDIDPEQRKELLSRISRQVTRLDELVQELAEIFRLGTGKLQLQREPVDLPELCHNVIADLESSGAEHQITLVCRGDLPPVPAERLKVRTVLSNIVGNALKYSPPDTAVTVRLETVGEDVRIMVEDQGPGVPAEHLPHIFDQFYRINTGPAKPKGYGLGLFIARKLVELHGGRIWAESEPGRGSTFIFILPLHPADAGDGSSRTARPRRAAAPAPRRRVLATPVSVPPPAVLHPAPRAPFASQWTGDDQDDSHTASVRTIA